MICPHSIVLRALLIQLHICIYFMTASWGMGSLVLVAVQKVYSTGLLLPPTTLATPEGTHLSSKRCANRWTLPDSSPPPDPARPFNDWWLCMNSYPIRFPLLVVLCSTRAFISFDGQPSRLRRFMWGCLAEDQVHVSFGSPLARRIFVHRLRESGLFFAIQVDGEKSPAASENTPALTTNRDKDRHWPVEELLCNHLLFMFLQIALINSMRNQKWQNQIGLINTSWLTRISHCATDTYGDNYTTMIIYCRDKI